MILRVSLALNPEAVGPDLHRADNSSSLRGASRLPPKSDKEASISAVEAISRVFDCVSDGRNIHRRQHAPERPKRKPENSNPKRPREAVPTAFQAGPVPNWFSFQGEPVEGIVSPQRAMSA
jgi:hypothetical protein